MAKKTAVKRQVVISTLEDLRAWLMSQAFPGWELVLSAYVSDSVRDGSRSNYSNYSMRLKIAELKVDLDLNAGSPADLARRFQNQGWPKIQQAAAEIAERARRPKIATPPLRRLTHEKPDPVLFR